MKGDNTIYRNKRRTAVELAKMANSTLSSATLVSMTCRSQRTINGLSLQEISVLRFYIGPSWVSINFLCNNIFFFLERASISVSVFFLLPSRIHHGFP